MRCKQLAAACGLVGLVAGCTLTLDLGSESLFPTGTSFVLTGTSDSVATNDGPCLVWRGENGLTYHLFQDPRVSNENFDAVTTPGVTSRLELATRVDLEVVCDQGSIVEVLDVLEIRE